MKTDMIGSASKNTYVPFIGVKMPFVCNNYRSLIPYIGVYRPSVFFTIKNKGFTLVELIMVVVVIGVLAALAIPNMRLFVERNRLTAITNDLLADISLARSEAIKRNLEVGICTFAAGPACGAGASWAPGWIVFVDTDSSGGWTAGDEVLRVRDPASNNITVTPPANLLHFSRRGEVAAGSGAITLCNTNIPGATNLRTITMAVTGRPSTTPGNC